MSPFARKWPTQCQPRPFYSQAQMQPCTQPPPPVPLLPAHAEPISKDIARSDVRRWKFHGASMCK